ncbi:MAG: SRPBCC family protein [Thermoanaerobaculia bacterium]
MRWLLYILGGLFGLIVLAVVALLIAGARANAGRLLYTVEVPLPPSAVWPWLTETEKLKQWIGWVDEIRPLNPEVQGVGARELFVMSDPNMKGKMEMEVETTVFEPPHHVTVKVGVPKGFTGSVDYLLTDLGGRTRIDYDGQFRYDHWFARLMEPLVTPQARKKVAEDLDRLVNLALKG